MVGVYGESFTPAKDPMFTKLVAILERERSRIQDLVHSGVRLNFLAIEYYQEISRSYYRLQRPGGNASIYDETVIQNEVIAMKESLSIQGDYNDNSVRIDKSVTHTTNVQNATIDTGSYTQERINTEIIKAILKSEEECVSRVELMALIPVKESQISEALEKLQVKGQIKIFNRESGEIVYGIDRLA